MKPRRLDLDYIAEPRRSRWLGYALLAVALAVAADLVLRYREAQLALERIEIAKGLLASERPKPTAVPRERLDEQARNAQTVMRQLSLPWAALIRTLEQGASQDVAILQLQPEAQQSLLRVQAEARNRDAMLDYLRRLAEAKTLTEVHLVSHQVQLEDPQQPVQFSLQARFRSAP